MSAPAKDEAELIQWMARGICCGNLSCENKDCHIDPICNAYNALAGIRAAGWAVVPVEPTEEIQDAIINAAFNIEWIEEDDAAKIYQAAIKAAAPEVKP
jgi:hypothetical protein